VRKYLKFFVDQDNNPLHKIPVQLTARGYFELEFDRQICEFRSAITKAYNDKATRTKKIRTACVCSCHTFQSMMRREGSKQKKAFITRGYETLIKKTVCLFA